MKKYLQFSTICTVLIFTAGNVAGQSGETRPNPVTNYESINYSHQSSSLTLAKNMGNTSLLLTLPTGVLSVLQMGSDRLVETQYTDGGWGWPLIAPPTYGNILGPITMGLGQAYKYTLDGNHLTALTAAGGYFLTKINNFSPSDGYLADMLDEIFDVDTYSDHVNTYFYGPLAAGTYNKNGAGILYDTAGYINLIRTRRAAGGIPNLAAWDLGMGLIGAESVDASTSEWIAGVKAEINELDGAAYYDVIGLAGAIYGLAFVEEDFDPTSGQHAAASNINDLADILASYQLDLGGFTWNSNYLNSGENNETIQETAYSLLALYEVDECNYSLNVHNAANYISSVQLATGGWKNWSGGSENNEVTAEAMWGITIIEDYDEDCSEDHEDEDDDDEDHEDDDKENHDDDEDHENDNKEDHGRDSKRIEGLTKYNTPAVEKAFTTTLSLGSNYPNPFNPTTQISYNLSKASQVTMTVYDMMGRQVKSLVQEFQPAGNHSVLWNATNDNGELMSGGMYFYQIKVGSLQKTHKMILLK